MALSKNHHYIPKSILRQFCFSNESILLFDASQPSKGYVQRSIDRAFQKFHGNTVNLASGEKTDYVEKWLAREIDDPLGIVLQNAKSDLRNIFRDDSKKILAKYLLALLLRSPRGREYWIENSDPFVSMLQVVYKLAKTFGVSDDICLFGGAGAPSDFKDALPVILPTLLDDEHVEFLTSSRLAIARPIGSSCFCVSDFPMMRYDDPRNSCDDKMHEYWFILSPSIAACFVAQSTLEIEGSTLFLPDSYVRRINFDFAMRSQFVASNCPVALHETVKHLGSFPTGRSLEETSPDMFSIGGKYF